MYTKGADEIIYRKLNKQNQIKFEEMENKVIDIASEGYWTMVLAFKMIPR